MSNIDQLKLPIVGLLLLAMCGSGPATAQTATPDSGSSGTVAGQGGTNAVRTKPGVHNQMMRGVLIPEAGVDPGMAVKAPRMPPQSTPVIHPRTTTPDGSVVVVPK